MKQLFTTIFFFSTFFLAAQTVADFENYDLSDESFLNGSDGTNHFESGNIMLPNEYTPAWNAWTGFAISNTTDIWTPGTDNQYSSIAGGGAEGSTNFAVSFASAPVVVTLNDDAIGRPIQGLYITNNTYAYMSVRDGDGFAKKFGGVTGNDPDWFKITFQAYKSGFIQNDGVEFFLADYTFQDPADDYIVNEWTWVDLTPLGDVDSLLISMSSTDTGGFGMNTPAYFCLDNLTTTDNPNSTKNLNKEIDFSIYPNPASEFLIFDWKKPNGVAQITDLQGKTWSSQILTAGQNSINLNALPKGFYTILVQTKDGFLSDKFVKK